MANVTVDVHARLDPRTFRRASNDAHDHFQRAGQDAGQAFSVNLATGINRGAPQLQRSLSNVTISTDRVRRAQDKLNDSYRSGDIERIIRDTQRLTKIQRDAHTVADRFAAAQRDALDVGSSGGGTGGVMMIGRAFGAVAGSGPGAVAAVTAAAGAFAQLAGIAASAAGSLWLIPGVLGGIASVIGTVKTATSGMDDVFSNMGDPVKFAEALRKVSPAAGDFAMSIKSALPYLRQLQQATQETFFAGTGPILTGLMDQYLPEIQQLTTGIAGAMNDAFAGIAQQLLTPDTQASVDALIQNLVTAFDQLGPAAAPFADALTKVMAAGSNALPGLAQGITNIANAFAKFIDDASRTGELDQWIEQGLTTVGDLAAILWDIGRIMKDLIPVGQQVLPSIVTGFEQMATITGPLVDLINGLGPAVDIFSGALRVAQGDFGGLTDMAEGFGTYAIEIFNNVRDVLDRMLDPIRAAIDLANNLPGLDIPQIPSIAGTPGPISLGGGPNASRERRGYDPINPTAGLPNSSPLRPPDPFWGVPTQGRWGSDPMVQLHRERNDLMGVGGSSGKTPEGLVPNADVLKSTLERMFPGIQVNADVHRQDAFGEHSSGEALDIMVGSNRNLGEQINRWLLQNADALGLQYNLWQQAQWDPSGAISPMENRGSPTANHMDHIHARVSAGATASGNVMPIGANSYQSGINGLYSGPMGGPTPVTVDGFSSNALGSLGLDGDLGLSRGLGGLVENLVRAIGIGALAPMTLQLQQQSGGYGSPAFGGTSSSFLPSMPSLSFPPMPSMSGPTLSSRVTPSSSVLGGGNPLPGPFGAQNPTAPAAMATTGPPSYATPQQRGFQPASGGGFNGIQGLPLAAASSAISAAGMGADAMGAMGGGSAAAGAMQIAMQLANRAIGYAGQVASIGVNGLLETFGMQDTAIGNPSNSWIGKVLSGFAGAKPASDNSSATEVPLKKQDAQQGAADGKDGRPAAQAGPTVLIQNQHNAAGRDGSGIAKDIAFDMYANGAR